MTTYYIYMDQGLVVDLRVHSLCSGQFSTCAPIVFYNENTQIAGLYHLGGCSQLDNMKNEHLITLFDRVKPTVVYVLCGAGIPLGGPALGHVDHVCNLIKGRPKFKEYKTEIFTHFNGKRDYSSITVSLINKLLSIKLGYSDEYTLKTNDKIKKLPDTVFFLGERNDKELEKWI